MPVKAITNFFPTEEVNICLKVIVGCILKIDAKVRMNCELASFQTMIFPNFTQNCPCHKLFDPISKNSQYVKKGIPDKLFTACIKIFQNPSFGLILPND